MNYQIQEIVALLCLANMLANRCFSPQLMHYNACSNVIQTFDKSMNGWQRYLLRREGKKKNDSEPQFSFKSLSSTSGCDLHQHREIRRQPGNGKNITMLARTSIIPIYKHIKNKVDHKLHYQVINKKSNKASISFCILLLVVGIYYDEY